MGVCNIGESTKDFWENYCKTQSTIKKEEETVMAATAPRHWIDDLEEEKNLKEDANGPRIFVIPPVYGDLALMTRIIKLIEAKGPVAANDKIVFLGNFLGETGDSRELINTLYAYQDKRLNQVILLRGPNEEEFIKSTSRFFKSPVGKNLLLSYREEHQEPYRPGVEQRLNAKAVMEARGFLETMCQYFLETEDYFICHSGINPKESLNDQRLKGLMYFGPKMMRSGKQFHKIVVHSQDVTQTVQNFSNRIGVPKPVDGILRAVVVKDGLKQDEECLKEIFEIKREAQGASSGSAPEVIAHVQSQPTGTVDV